ncbi:hypothetical protein Q9L58_008333 [Maublancomyces gigas]|uniref:Uncharacterized protein n=1 Tax=Discina gigas TaxID=1032678 RepID=A0ABR3GAE2_9PEZI
MKNERVVSLETTAHSLDTRVGSPEAKVDNLEIKVISMETKVDTLDRKFNARFVELKNWGDVWARTMKETMDEMKVS